MIKLAFHDISGGPSVNGDIFDRIISKVTNSPYVHVEMVLDSNNLKASKCFSAVPDLGVRFTVIDLTESMWKLLDMPNLDVTQCYNDALKYIGQRYDWAGILGIVMPFDQYDPKDKFCSEVVTRVMQDEGLFPGVKAFRTSPADLYRMVRNYQTS